MGGAVAAAAAVSAQAQRRVVSYFMSNNAVSAASAVPFNADKQIEQRIFDRMRGNHVIVPVGNGGYYLDIPKYDAWKHRQNVTARRFVLAAVLVLGIALAVALALGGR